MLNMEVKNLIDYFVLCGLDVKSGLEAESTSPDEPTNTKSPLERSYKSKILYHFPENLPWNPFDEDAVTQLCLPKGLIFQKHSSKPTFHPFIITREDGSRVYGATLTFFELIEDQSICNAMQSLQTMYDAEHSSANRSLSSHTTPSSIRNHHRSSSSTQMELTNRSSQSSTQPIVPKSLFRTNCQNHNPTMDIENQTSLTQSNKESMIENLEPSAYDTVLKSSNGNYKTPRRSLTTKLSVSSPTKICHYNILKDRLYASKCICIISQSPLNKSFSKILQTLFDMVEKTDLLGINLECHLYNLIYEIPMPANGQAVKLQVGCRPIAAYMPDPISQLPILDFDLMDFFRLLGVTNIVNLYITGLLEHQILLYSKDYYLLMLVAESLTSLFFPFSWLKPYVPIVPASNLHFIEAPVPYIMGFHHKDIDKEFFKQGQRCFVDIDSGTVSCPEALPEFPQKNKLIKDINEIIVYFVDKKQKLKKQTSSANLDILHASQAYVRIAELAHKTGAFCDQNMSQDHTRSGSNGQKESWMDEEEVVGLQFNRCVRELFLQKFVQMFATYEKFVIVPNMENNDLENWWMNRDHAGNFDSKMFLIEQPSPRLPFLSHFLSTQMFVSFIDLKIVSLIDPQKPADANIRIFDEKIRAFKTHDINLYEVKSDHAKGLVDIKHLENEILNQLKKEPFQAPCVLSDRQNDTKHIESAFMAKFTLTATEQIQENTENVYLFENIDKNCLKADENLINQIYSEMIKKKELLMKNREQFKNSQIQLSLDKPSKQSKEKRRSRQKDKNDSPTTEHTESKIQELNPFIQSLLKESKLKTKRMLVEKMPEAATLGHGEARISGIEENMLIASLCDLIERIWGHGLHNKGGKSALWNHLSNYRKLIQYLHPNPLSNLDPINVSSRSTTLPRKRVTSALTPDPISQRTTPYMASLNRAYVKSTSNLASVPTGNHKRAVSSNGEPVISLSPLKNDLLADLARIDKLTEVKTEIGLARAFVRLSLEKKLLADHLRQLLSEAELLRALYKKHAFLRQEEEREQFIYHLQSLNVVDYFCFTNHFKSMPTDYLVMIVPSKKFNSSTTSANPYMKLFGSLAESDVTLIPKNSLELVISVIFALTS